LVRLIHYKPFIIYHINPMECLPSYIQPEKGKNGEDNLYR
jgi:hypothetical protein